MRWAVARIAQIDLLDAGRVCLNGVVLSSEHLHERLQHAQHAAVVAVSAGAALDIETAERHRTWLSMFDALTLMMLSGIPQGDRLRTADQEYELHWNRANGQLGITPWPFAINELALDYAGVHGANIHWTLTKSDS